MSSLTLLREKLRVMIEIASSHYSGFRSP